MQLGCSNIKDLGFQGGDNLSEAIDLDDAALSFDCGYEIFGSTQQSHPTYTSENSRGLDCLVKERNLSVTESLSHAETALEVLWPAFVTVAQLMKMYLIFFPLSCVLVTVWVKIRPENIQGEIALLEESSSCHLLRWFEKPHGQRSTY